MMGSKALRTNGDSASKNGPETRLQPRPALTTTRRNRAMANRSDITPELCRQLLRYEPETGKLVWLPREPYLFSSGRYGREHQANAWNAKHAGRRADVKMNDAGYRLTSLFKRDFRSHRLIFMMHTGACDFIEIDHINGDRADNRLSNLREVSKSENARNVGVRTNNTSGVCGVYWNKAVNKWQAYIKTNGKAKYLGIFVDFEDAVKCRRAAERELGFHENHGRRFARGYGGSQCNF